MRVGGRWSSTSRICVFAMSDFGSVDPFFSVCFHRPPPHPSLPLSLTLSHSPSVCLSVSLFNFATSLSPFRCSIVPPSCRCTKPNKHPARCLLLGSNRQKRQAGERVAMDLVVHDSYPWPDKERGGGIGGVGGSGSSSSRSGSSSSSNEMAYSPTFPPASSGGGGDCEADGARLFNRLITTALGGCVELSKTGGTGAGGSVGGGKHAAATTAAAPDVGKGQARKRARTPSVTSDLDLSESSPRAKQTNVNVQVMVEVEDVGGFSIVGAASNLTHAARGLLQFCPPASQESETVS